VDAEAFVRDGYVAVRGAVDPATVAGCQELTWEAMARRGIRRDDPASWPAVVQGFATWRASRSWPRTWRRR